MNHDYVFQNMITYIGNKKTLLPYIEQIVIDIKKSLHKDLIISLDGFSGSGVVARMLKYHSKILFVNGWNLILIILINAISLILPMTLEIIFNNLLINSII